MANFDIAYRIVHGNEGGYANHPADKGGETYRGIARRYHGQWPGWALIDAIKAQRAIRTNEIIKDAALNALVVNFYRATWNQMRGDQIKSQPLANLYYDFYTNSGGATKVLQRVLVYQFLKRIEIDGEPGPVTLAALNECDPVSLHNRLKAARIAYVQDIVRNNPSQGVFLPTWLNRINRFPDEVKKKPVSPSPSAASRPGTATATTASKLFSKLRNPFKTDETATA